MSKFLLLILTLFLVACSQTSERAPVYDVKSNKGILNDKGGTYVARNSEHSIQQGQQSYIVKQGDTLYSIAWRANMDVETLIARNNLKAPYIIKEGQVLQLTKSGTKRVSHSQKTKKKPVSSCTGQSCNRKIESGLVKKELKTYPAKTPNKRSNKNQSGSSGKVTGWQWPSKGKVIKTFARSTQGMKGISISGQRGEPVYAAADGKVVYAGNGLRGYGNLIIIKHNYDYLSAYAHNEKIIIKENEHVKVGQKIAEMGDSETDSVYLHFDIRYRGKSVDPMRYLPKK